MKKPGFILHLLFVVLPLLAAGQQVGHNYVMARTMLSDDGTEYYDEVTYYDGYGYPYETVRKRAGGSGGNVATVLRYDRSRRVAEEWLPTATGLDYLAPAEFYSAARSSTGDRYPIRVTATKTRRWGASQAGIPRVRTTQIARNGYHTAPIPPRATTAAPVTRQPTER